MGIDDLVNKGKGLFEQNRGKIQDALKSEQAERISDNILDGASGLAKKVVPKEHHAKVDDFRDRADKAVGTDGTPGAARAADTDVARDATGVPTETSGPADAAR